MKRVESAWRSALPTETCNYRHHRIVTFEMKWLKTHLFRLSKRVGVLFVVPLLFSELLKLLSNNLESRISSTMLLVGFCWLQIQTTEKTLIMQIHLHSEDVWTLLAPTKSQTVFVSVCSFLMVDFNVIFVVEGSVGRREGGSEGGEAGERRGDAAECSWMTETRSWWKTPFSGNKLFHRARISQTHISSEEAYLILNAV